MKKRAAILFLVLSVGCIGWTAAVASGIGCLGRPRIERAQKVIHHPGGAVAVGERIRICSYNLENFTDGWWDGPERTFARVRAQAEGAAENISRIDPDIVIIEEIENGKALKKLNNCFRRPYNFGYVTHFNGRGRQVEKLNIGVLSRVPLADVREIDFEYMHGHLCPPRGVLSFEVNLGGGHCLLVYGVHFKSNWGKVRRNRILRRRAAEIVRRDAAVKVERRPDCAWEILVTGDMNVDPEAPGFGDDPTLKPFGGWQDLWLGRPRAERVTVPTRHGSPDLEFPPATFDRFIVSEELKHVPWRAGNPMVLKAGVDTNNVFAVPGGGTGHVSDHYPVYLDIYRRTEQ